MSLQIEKLEKNMVKLTIETSVETFEAAIERAYRKNRSRMSIPGFRKGKAPRNMIEKLYGVGVFYEDAANDIIPDAYEKAVEESGLEIVSRPEVDVIQIEKGKPFIFTAEVAVKPEVTLGEYKGIEVPGMDVSVSEEEITKELETAREQNSRLVTLPEDTPAENGDQAVIDFEGFVDGVAFEGGKGENYPLTLGSHSFIDTFEDQLVGRRAGEDIEVNVTFPAEYQVAELAGKPAMFRVSIKEIKRKELPELDDEFAQDVSEFDTLQEYREDIAKKLTGRKEEAAKREKENTVVDRIIENAQMEIPDPMLDSQARQMAEEFARNLQYQGMQLEQYLQYSGMNVNSFLESLRPQAQKRIQSRLVLEAVVKAEGIEPSQEEIEEEIQKIASMYQMEPEQVKEQLEGDNQMENLKMDVAVQKAIDLVTAAAVEVEEQEAASVEEVPAE